MKPARAMVVALCLGTLSGCSLLGRYSSETVASSTDATTSTTTVAKGVIANKSLNLSPSISLPYESIVMWMGYSAAAYLVLDPLAPNWEIQQAAFPDQHVHITLKMKRFYAGGAGEARQVFQRRAGDLMRGGGFNGYDIVEYNESLESSVLGSQRVARGVVRLTHTDG